jgi:hypothetical protein
MRKSRWIEESGQAGVTTGRAHPNPWLWAFFCNMANKAVVYSKKVEVGKGGGLTLGALTP